MEQALTKIVMALGELHLPTSASPLCRPETRQPSRTWPTSSSSSLQSEDSPGMMRSGNQRRHSNSSGVDHTKGAHPTRKEARSGQSTSTPTVPSQLSTPRNQLITRPVLLSGTRIQHATSAINPGILHGGVQTSQLVSTGSRRMTCSWLKAELATPRRGSC